MADTPYCIILTDKHMLRNHSTLYNPGQYSTHAVSPGRGCIGCCFLFVKCVSIVQPLFVPLCLTILVGKTPHCPYAGEGLCGHLVGLSQGLLNLYSNSLKNGLKNKI